MSKELESKRTEENVIPEKRVFNHNFRDVLSSSLRVALSTAVIGCGLTAALLYEKNQPATAASNTTTASAGVPTPAPGAMSIYEVENPMPDTLTVTETITDTAGFINIRTFAVPGCSIGLVHLRDNQNIPIPFTGAMTLEADRQFTATIVGYNYPGLIPVPTDDDLVRWADLYGEGQVTVRSVQAVAGRWNSNLCSSNYDRIADTANGNSDVDQDGRPLPDGIITVADVQTVAGRWGQTYSITPTAVITP